MSKRSITMRIEAEQLKEIDKIADFRYQDRTTFILQAITFYKNYLRRRGELK